MPPDSKPTEVRLQQDTIDHLEEKMRAAVSAGISEALRGDSAKEFWTTGLELLKTEAQKKTGLLVMAGALALVRRIGFFILAGGIVYAVGGWSALSALWKVLTQGTPP